MATFPLQIVTPDGMIFDGDAEGILVRTVEGDVEILASHADYFASLGTGRAKLTVSGNVRNASAQGGFISVRSGEVRLVATTFEFADEIDVKRAEEAKKRAEDTIATSDDEKTVRVAKAKLARAINRINVSELK